MTYLEKLETQGGARLPGIDGKPAQEIRVDLVAHLTPEEYETEVLTLANVRLLVEAELAEYRDVLLNQDYGTEWEGPDGAIYRAVMNDRELALERVRFEVGAAIDTAIEWWKNRRIERKRLGRNSS